MEQKKYRSMKIGDIVANDFRAAQIFKNAGIDFCCGGNQSMEQACEGKMIDIAALETKLVELENTETDNSHNFKEWKLDFLCDYIINTHHKTVMELLPQLTFYTQKIADVHGNNHPELVKIAKLFAKVDTELRHHLANEEAVLFPAIKEVMRSGSKDSKIITIREMAIMKTEHEYAGSVLDEIKDLTWDYTVPPDGCSTYEVTYKLLEQFTDDLHIHVHLENNILYPKALELSK